MQNTCTLKSTLLALGFSVFCTTASAQLSADKTDVNSTTGKATVTVTFSGVVSGDLYLAAMVGGQLMFFADNGSTISTTIAPFISNDNFSTPRHVLDVNSAGIPSGTYSLYQVVVKPNTPRELSSLINNIIGDGLSELKFNINLGSGLYKDLTCARSSCHGSNPGDNIKGVLKGTRVLEIKNSMKKNANDMGFLSGTSDADLQAVAEYLKTFF